jgi:uncharacterized protein involved in exopolysaccharide biosynthesis
LNRAPPGVQHRARPATLSPAVPVVIGAVVFAILGWFLTVIGESGSQATTRLSVHPDPPLSADAGMPSPDQADRFLQSEVLIIAGDEFRRDVASRAGDDDPAIDAAQVGTTDVIAITATAANAEAAANLANAAADVYVQRREDGASTRLEEARTEIADQLSETSQALQGLAASAPEDPVAQARRVALEDELARLTGLDNELRLAAVEGGSAVTIIDPATAEEAVSTASPVRNALLGALVGTLVGLVGALILQRHGVVRGGAGRWNSTP